jgi:hypothetical protein
MPIIAPGRSSTLSTDTPAVRSEAARQAWGLLGSLGIAFIIMGGIDIALGAYPLSFGDAEWEFGVVSAILNGFAIPTMGGFLLVGSLIARGKFAAARTMSVLAFLVVLILVGLGLLYVTVLPIALKSVQGNPVLALGMKKATVKGLVFLVAYIALFVVLGRKGMRAQSRN